MKRFRWLLLGAALLTTTCATAPSAKKDLKVAWCQPWELNLKAGCPSWLFN
ncbi:MAG TPA: hypothetical protein VJA27_02490 [Patescibacteria group bacterium]|nr:hypothetical protein [Patescibacteria group bacterium]